jgi:hypothetical protein
MRPAYLFLFMMMPAFMSMHAAARGTKLNEASLKRASEQLDRALERKDSMLLSHLLSSRLQYGHSNGWIETKEQLIADLFNGKLSYKAITLHGEMPTPVIEGRTGLVRSEITADILLDGKPLNLKLSVLQVWIFDRGRWILIGRQSTKV